jgi:hypothetical protein
VNVTLPKQGTRQWCEAIKMLRDSNARRYHLKDRGGVATGQNKDVPEDIALEWAAQHDFGGVYEAYREGPITPGPDLVLPSGVRLDVKNGRSQDRSFIAEDVFNKHRALTDIDFYLFGFAWFEDDTIRWIWKGLVGEGDVEQMCEWHERGNPPCWRVVNYYPLEVLS